MLTKVQLQVGGVALLVISLCGYYFGNFERTVLSVLLISCFLLAGILLLTKANWFYFLFVALIPISVDVNFLGDSKMNIPSEAMLITLFGVFLLFHRVYWLAFRRIVVHPISILLIADLLIQFLTSFTSTHIDVAFKRFFIKGVFVLFFFVAVNMAERPKTLISFFLWYAIGLIPVMYFTLSHHANYGFDPRIVFDVCAPYFNDHTIYGACLAFLIPMLIIVLKFWKVYSMNNQWRLLFGILVLAILLSLFLALSRAAILSLVFAGLFALALHFRIQFKTLLFFLGTIVLVFALNWNSIYTVIQQNEAVSNDGKIVNHLTSVSNVRSDASNLERINRWVCAVRMFQEKPLTGFGPGTYQFEYNQFQTVENKTYISTNAGDRGNAHSEYLTYLSENGIFGFLLYLVLVFSVLYFGMKNHYQLNPGLMKMANLGALLGLITFFFHGVFNMFIDQVKMAGLVYTSIGIIVWINQRLKNQKINVEHN